MRCDQFRISGEIAHSALFEVSMEADKARAIRISARLIDVRHRLYLKYLGNILRSPFYIKKN